MRLSLIFILSIKTVFKTAKSARPTFLASSDCPYITLLLMAINCIMLIDLGAVLQILDS